MAATMTMTLRLVTDTPPPRSHTTLSIMSGKRLRLAPRSARLPFSSIKPAMSAVMTT